MTSAEFLDFILQGNGQSDEAMYFVLKERVGERLEEKYRMHEHVFFEEFEDVVDDFFLYLREGIGKTREPYHALRSIVNKDAFEGWLVSTFRNYLTNRSNAEEQTCELNEHNTVLDIKPQKHGLFCKLMLNVVHFIENYLVYKINYCIFAHEIISVRRVSC